MARRYENTCYAQREFSKRCHLRPCPSELFSYPAPVRAAGAPGDLPEARISTDAQWHVWQEPVAEGSEFYN